MGDRFYVLPALGAVLEPIRFNLLALSRKHVRLLACSRKGFEPVALPEGMATSVAAEGGFDYPDHDLENRSSGGRTGEARDGFILEPGPTGKTHGSTTSSNPSTGACIRS